MGRHLLVIKDKALWYKLEVAYKSTRYADFNEFLVKEVIEPYVLKQIGISPSLEQRILNLESRMTKFEGQQLNFYQPPEDE